MKFAKIAGLGKYLPADKLTNFDLEKMVDTSDEWITSRTGIKERRIVRNKKASSDLAHEAAKVALKRAGIKGNELDAIIVSTITPDRQFPSTACYVQNSLKANKAAAFDLSAACSGYVYSLTVAWQFISGGLYKKVLVIGSEVLSLVTDWQDRSTCVLFGDGAGAAVLVDSSKKSFLSAYLGADGSQEELLMLPAGGSRLPANNDTVGKRQHFIKMKGNELFRIAVRVMVNAAREALKQANLTSSDVNLFIPHQANIRIINAVAERLSISEDKLFLNIERYGNMSAASSAVALCEAWEEGRIKKDDIIMLDTFGGGLVWGSNVIRWIE